MGLETAFKIYKRGTYNENTQQMINAEHTHMLRINSKSTENMCYLPWKDVNLEIEVSSPDNAKRPITSVLDDTKGVVSVFNINYLLDILKLFKTLGTENVIVKLSDKSNHPIGLITGDGNYSALIAPRVPSGYDESVRVMRKYADFALDDD